MTVRRLLTAVTWLGAAALVVLAARSLAYALAQPTPLRPGLQHAAGGPRVVAVALLVLGLTAGLGVAIVWLASVGVRERAALVAGHVEAPRLRLLRVAAHALALMLVTGAAFAALESYLHVRAGLPWHGLGCLTGPVHVGAMPILAGLSVLAAAAIDAAVLVLRWMRRTLWLLLEPPPRAHRADPLLVPIVELIAAPAFHFAAARPRPPPLAAG
jgi:hypothetical protein